MATNIQVIHIEKRVSIPSGLNRHITRQQFVTEGDTRKVEVWVPDNADPKKTKGNMELISRKTENEDGISYEMTLQQAVDKRIKEADIRPRIGQVTSLEMIFSGSHDRMAAMSRKELKNWADDTVKWAKETWGEENVVSASLHVDEKTPHIHMIVVPIVTGQSRRTSYQQNKGKSKKQYKIDHTKSRLCVNEVYTTGKLYAYHDSYAKEVSSKYGMERGVRAEPGSKKKHTNSIEYNRMLAAQAAEQQALIDELTSDYESKKTKIEEDIQQRQMNLTTLSSKIDEEENKLTKAKAKSKKAEKESKDAEEKLTELGEKKTGIEQEIAQLQTKKDTLSSAVEEEQKKFDAAEAKTKKAEERLTSQQEKIEKNTRIINNQVADFNAKKVELDQTKAAIEANKETITQQKQTISANEATIQKQEKLKSSTVISDDAADKKILEKLQTVKGLEEEEARLSRSIVSKKTELATADANLQKRLRMIDAKANLDDVPKKGAFGYNSDKVTAFIESVEMASLKRAMYWTPTDIKVDTAIQEENTRLRKVEDDYKDFMNSPKRMQQRIEHLENESIRRRIAENLKYALKKEVEIIRFTVDKTPNGDDIFVKFTIKGDSTQWAGRITPKEYINYTDKPLNSLQELKDHWTDKIWHALGSLSEIQQKREKEDTLARYSTKLSTLTKEDIKVTDYVADGNHYLLFASNGRAYEVNPNGSTWSTKDSRVKTLDDCRRLSKENIWKNEGDINNPKISRGRRR